MTDEAVRETVDIVNERGQIRRYETVASRLSRFRVDHPDYLVNTKLLDCNDEVVRVRAEISIVFARDSGNDMGQQLIAAAHAEEYRAASDVNATSALENCETSALGRALAFLGYGSTESIASADEVVAAKAKANAFAQTRPGALILLQNAAKVSYSALETCWRKTLSGEDREACRGYLPGLKREAKEKEGAPAEDAAFGGAP